jgi:hypothetical protein
MSFKTGFHQIVSALEAARVPYIVGGSFASAHHGIPRSTNDADLLVDLQPRHIPTLIKALQPDFYIDEYQAADSARMRRSFNVIHIATAYKFDLFPASTAFHYSQLERGVEATFDFMGEPLTCRMSSAEDIILAKLDWYRIGGCSSERQLNDITNVVAVSGPHLDHEYLKTWAAKLGVSELLNKALTESNI